MAENEPAAVGGEDAIPKHVPAGDKPLSVRDATNALTDWRNKLNAKAAEPLVSQPEAAAEAPAAEESADEADANPDAGHGETPEVEAQQEPIDPPVSWTTAEKERWQSIPRETQEYIAQRETERERLLTKSRTEAAEQLKGLTAREQAMEQARLQFEAATQAALQGLQQQLQGEFADIKTMDDVKKLANDDWARYLRWDAHQKDIAAKMAAVNEAQQRQAQEAQSSFAKFAEEQDKRFVERVPEFADEEKAAPLKSAAIKTLKNVGFPDDELAKNWNGQEKLSLRDARMQELIHKAARWDQAQEAKKLVAKKPLPPVQRPGVDPGKPDPRASIRQQEIATENSKGMASIENAVQLQRMRRDAANRQH
jgi:hypothetical protein